MFERLKDELKEDEKIWTERISKRITDAEEPFNLAREYATETRWEQFKAGAITEDKFKELTVKRIEKRIRLHYEKKMDLLDRIASAGDLISISIVVEYSPYGSATASCDVHSEHRYELCEGRAAGYGYDKESAAIGEALNKSDAVLKALYQYKEERLAEGMSDYSAGASSGHNNRDIIAYGAGYAVLPYFEGGVGANCFWRIFDLLGFDTHCNYTGKHSNFYLITRR